MTQKGKTNNKKGKQYWKEIHSAREKKSISSGIKCRWMLIHVSWPLSVALVPHPITWKLNPIGKLKECPRSLN